MPGTTTAASMENTIDRLAEALFDQFGDTYPVATFEDRIIFRNYDSGNFYEATYTITDETVTFGEAQEVEQQYVAKALKEAGIDYAEQAELTGPIVYKNAAKQIAYAAVLVPGEIDHDGESVTKEQTERAAHEWMQFYQNLDLQHTLNNVGVPVESYLTPEDRTVKAIDGEEMVLPAGTWILGSRLNDDTWTAVEKGDLTGYSVMGMARAAIKSADAALKKTLLKDLGPDWVATYVSVVDRPAVPKAKFFALKNQEAEQQPARKEGTVERIKQALGLKEGRKYSKATLQKIVAAHDAMVALIKDAEEENRGEKFIEGSSDMDKSEIKQIVDESIATVKDQLQSDIAEQLEALKAELTPAEPKDEPKEEPNEEPKEETTDETSELEAFKAEINAKLDAITKQRPTSQALKTQTETDPAPTHGRDVFGRRAKR